MQGVKKEPWGVRFISVEFRGYMHPEGKQVLWFTDSFQTSARIVAREPVSPWRQVLPARADPYHTRT